MADSGEVDGSGQAKKKKKSVILSRDIIVKRLKKKAAEYKPSPMVELKEVLEEAKDKKRFVGDTMFWKYYADIDIGRIYHTDSAEFMNLKVMFYETIFFVVLLAVITIYIFSIPTRDVSDSTITQERYWSGCANSSWCSIRDVNSIDSFWRYLQNDFVNQAFTDFPEEPPSVASITSNFDQNDFAMVWHPRFIGPQQSTVLLGSMRLRQQRSRKNIGCTASKLYSHIFPDCYGPYSSASRSMETYSPRFAPTYIADAYVYQTQAETSQALAEGKLNAYAGDGFVVDVPWNKSDTKEIIGDLWKWSWVDRATRAVIIELTTLNTNVNVLVNSRIIFEFGPTGTVVATVKTKGGHVAMFSPATGSPESMLLFIVQFITLFFFVLWSIYVGWLIFKTCRNFAGDNPLKYLKQQSLFGVFAFFGNTFWHYIGYFWNLVDLVIIALFVAHMILRITTYTAMASHPNMNPTVLGHPEMFMPLSSVMEPLLYSNNLLSLLGLLVWIKVLKYLCMSSYFRLLVRILERCMERLVVFSVLLLFMFFGFAVAFFIGRGGYEELYSTLPGSFLVSFFLLIDGYDVDAEWFGPTRPIVVPVIFVIYIALVYFVLINIAIATVLDTYATTDRSVKDDPDRKNPMIVFIIVYYNRLLGITMVLDNGEANMKSDSLAIQLEILPGVVRRKWIEKKRRMQAIADKTFAGMELYPAENDTHESAAGGNDWMLPSSRADVFDKMNAALVKKPVALYEVPQALMSQIITRSQLQRLMDEDITLPILLREKKAENVIQRFKRAAAAYAEAEGDALVPPVQRLQGQVFGEVDSLERVQLGEDMVEVPEINELTGYLSETINGVRNKFRVELTGIIEATAALFEHLVELTQSIDNVRANHEGVLDAVRTATNKEMMQGLGNKGFLKR